MYVYIHMCAADITCFKENIVNYLRKLLIGKMYIWEVAAFPSWGSCHLGNCHLGKCTFGKLPALEKAFGKVPNITPGITAS